MPEWRSFFLDMIKDGWFPCVSHAPKDTRFECRHPDHEKEFRAFCGTNGERKEFVLCLKCQIWKEIV